jgi:hypothetical protein
MGKGSTTSGASTTMIRYAPYIETMHQAFVTKLQAEESAAVDASPYANYTELAFENAFFGSGFILDSYPALYDMFGKFMAGLDIDSLFDEIFTDTTTGPIIQNIIAQEADLLDDDITERELPRFETGMRDMNAVMSSSFVTGRSLIETARLKALARFSADLQRSLIPVATERWRAHLEWNKVVITQYADILKFYIQSKVSIDTHNLDIEAKSAVWPFTILEYERAAIGTMNQPQQTSSTSTQTQKQSGGVLGGILQGVGAASMFL